MTARVFSYVIIAALWLPSYAHAADGSKGNLIGPFISCIILILTLKQMTSIVRILKAFVTGNNVSASARFAGAMGNAVAVGAIVAGAPGLAATAQRAGTAASTAFGGTGDKSGSSRFGSGEGGTFSRPAASLGAVPGQEHVQRARTISQLQYRADTDGKKEFGQSQASADRERGIVADSDGNGRNDQAELREALGDGYTPSDGGPPSGGGLPSGSGPGGGQSPPLTMPTDNVSPGGVILPGRTPSHSPTPSPTSPNYDGGDDSMPAPRSTPRQTAPSGGGGNAAAGAGTAVSSDAAARRPAAGEAPAAPNKRERFKEFRKKPVKEQGKVVVKKAVNSPFVGTPGLLRAGGRMASAASGGRLSVSRPNRPGAGRAAGAASVVGATMSEGLTQLTPGASSAAGAVSESFAQAVPGPRRVDRVTPSSSSGRPQKVHDGPGWFAGLEDS